jgi:thiamine pyrophosphate-dependent acetolactate synthase large subunit-like protein
VVVAHDVIGCPDTQAFGGAGYKAETAAELESVCARAFAARLPALVNIILDPMAGVESGNVHDFNLKSTPTAKL